MKVERLDIFDFKVTLTEDEFRDLSMESDEISVSLESIMTSLLSEGFDDFSVKDY